MSAPDTDVEKQSKRHSIPLVGMIASVVFALVLLVALIMYVTAAGNEPGDDVPVGQESSAAN